MKAALLTGIRQFEVREVADPQLSHDNEVLVRIKMVGVCGSDIHYYTAGRIGNQIVRFPFIVGHETAGVVERTGKRVTRVRPGQRIAIDPSIVCGECDQCRAGRENTCRKLIFIGNPQQREGALCEYIVLPEGNCYPIPENTSFEQAVLSEPLAIAVYSVERAQLADGVSVAVLGAGPIGASVFHVLRTKNVGHVHITDKIPERLRYAQRLHPHWCGSPEGSDVVKEIARRDPLMMDVVFECSGDRPAFDQALTLLKPGGKLLLVGIPEFDDVTFPIHELRRKEITILNIRRQAKQTRAALDLLASGRVQLDAMATHHFPLAEAGRAFDLVAHYRDGVMKAMITLD